MHGLEEVGGGKPITTTWFTIEITIIMRSMYVVRQECVMISNAGSDCYRLELWRARLRSEYNRSVDRRLPKLN